MDVRSDVRTDVPTDGLTFPPLMLLGQLGGVNLKKEEERNHRAKI